VEQPAGAVRRSAPFNPRRADAGATPYRRAAPAGQLRKPSPGRPRGLAGRHHDRPAARRLDWDWPRRIALAKASSQEAQPGACVAGRKPDDAKPPMERREACARSQARRCHARHRSHNAPCGAPPPHYLLRGSLKDGGLPGPRTTGAMTLARLQRAQLMRGLPPPPPRNIVRRNGEKVSWDCSTG
jgi:hypothetical protein